MSNPQKHRWSRRTKKSVRLVALDVAEAFCERHGVDDPDEAEQVQVAAFSVAQSLADCGRPGAWDQIDIEDLLRKLPGGHCFPATVREIVRLIAWLGTMAVLQQRYCLRLVRRIQAHPRVDDALQAELDSSYRSLLPPGS